MRNPAFDFLRSTGVSLALTVMLTVGSGAGMVGLTGCAGVSPPVVTINDTIKITKQEYDKAYKELSDRLVLPPKEKQEALKNKVIQEQLKQSTLNKLIFSALLKADATQLNIAVTDSDINKFKQDNLKNIGGEANFKALLKNEGVTEKEFDQNLKEELLADKFVSARAGSRLMISDADAKGFYEAHKSQFNVPERIKVRHILFKVIDKDVKDTLVKDSPKITSGDVTKKLADIHHDKLQQAEKLLTQVQADPKAFDKLARERSEDQASAIFGGDLNYMVKDSTDPVFWAAAVATQPGTIHPAVVKSQFGYHIIQLDSYEKPHTMTFDEAKGQIKNMMAQQRKQQELFAWVSEKRSKAKIEFAKGFAPETPQVNEMQAKMNQQQVPAAGGKPGQTAPVKQPEAQPTGGTAAKATALPAPQGQPAQKG